MGFVGFRCSMHERFYKQGKNVAIQVGDKLPSVDLQVMGKQRELDRLWGLYALERHRNRDLPEIDLPTSADEYQHRIDETDDKIRAFLEDQDIITIPGYVRMLATNVPWIVRDSGPNFWEQIQFRNPTPDHLHAVIPGHRFDAAIE